MTKDIVKEARGLLEKITQGEWRVIGGKIFNYYETVLDTDNCKGNDLVFIASAPTLVKGLIQRIEELEKNCDACDMLPRDAKKELNEMTEYAREKMHLCERLQDENEKLKTDAKWCSTQSMADLVKDRNFFKDKVYELQQANAKLQAVVTAAENYINDDTDGEHSQEYKLWLELQSAIASLKGEVR